MTRSPTLVADIGGSHSRLALADGPALRADTCRRYDNDGFAGMTAVLRAYLDEMAVTPAAVCLAAAGPVTGAQVRLTNRDWHVTRTEVAAATGAGRVLLINDLQAMGHALAVPAIAGSPLTQTRLVLAIGTGMNAAVAHPGPRGAVVPPGESGFATLPFTGPQDAALAAALARDFGAPVIEAALSGAGLSRVHRLLTGESRPPAEITSGRADTRASLDAVLRFLGATLGTLALSHLPHGGIYLAGSVGRALYPHLKDENLRRGYLGRGRYDDLLSGFRFDVIRDDSAPLAGAAMCSATTARA